MSRVGYLPIEIPSNVKLSIVDSDVEVEGPKGKLSWTLPDGIRLNLAENVATLERPNDLRQYKSLHGLSRSLVANMVEGVSKGFKRKLEIHGVGFRAAVKGNILDLSLGFSHPLEHPIPDGINVKVEDNTNILIEGFDKQKVGQFASDIRSYYPPEPYKGKGVRYSDEYVRRKAGKSVQG